MCAKARNTATVIGNTLFPMIHRLQRHKSRRLYVIISIVIVMSICLSVISEITIPDIPRMNRDSVIARCPVIFSSGVVYDGNAYALHDAQGDTFIDVRFGTVSGQRYFVFPTRQWHVSMLQLSWTTASLPGPEVPLYLRQRISEEMLRRGYDEIECTSVLLADTITFNRIWSNVWANAAVFAIALLGVLGSLAMFRQVRSEYRSRRGQCLYCRYDLKGTISLVCPECGRETRRGALGSHSDDGRFV